jgi:hypothetical protein
VPLLSDTPEDAEIERTLWAAAMQPYIKNNAVYACPSASEDYEYGGATLQDAQGYRFTYYINGYLNAWATAGSGAPASVIAFSEAQGKESLKRVSDRMAARLAVAPHLRRHRDAAVPAR